MTARPPLTEEELREIERAVDPGTYIGDGPLFETQIVRRLVDEVRRLRAVAHEPNVAVVEAVAEEVTALAERVERFEGLAARVRPEMLEAAESVATTPASLLAGSLMTKGELGAIVKLLRDLKEAAGG